MATSDHHPIVSVAGNRAIEYLFECISLFNEGYTKVEIQAYGRNISKALEIAHILKQELHAKLLKSESFTFRFQDIPMAGLRIPVQVPKSTPLDHPQSETRSELDESFGKSGFIHFCTYQLLCSRYLKKSQRLTISLPANRDHRGSKEVTGKREILAVNRVDERTTYTSDPWKYARFLSSRTESALFRSGVLLPQNWVEVAKQLSKHDDVIAGLDTNVFYNCHLSRHILPAMSLVEHRPYVHTPNWLLLVVPATVMYELEEAANIRQDNGLLRHQGRMAYRALQEILELGENIDIPGVSVIISGEADPVLDTRADISGIRKDLHRMFASQNPSLKDRFKLRKSSSGDMTIRNQFKRFLRQIDFHKGTYFLTADKSNSALALAEGLHPIYITHPGRRSNEFLPMQVTNEGTEKDVEDFQIRPALGTLLYELCVSHGEILIDAGEQSFTLECDKKGSSMDYWLRKSLRIDRYYLEALLEGYEGRFNLKKVALLWRKLTTGYESIEWPKPITDAFADTTESLDYNL